MQLRQQLERLTDAYLRAVMPLDEYERRRRDLEQRLSALARQEEQLRDDTERQRQLAGLATSLEAFRARVQRGLAEATFEQRRQLVLLLIDRVIVTDADVEIRYVLPTSPESEHVRFCQLRKDYFHHPSTWQDYEAARACYAAHDDQRQAEQKTGKESPEAIVDTIGEDDLDPAVQRLHTLEQRPGAICVLDIGGMDHHAQQQPLRIDRNV